MTARERIRNLVESGEGRSMYVWQVAEECKVQPRRVWQITKEDYGCRPVDLFRRPGYNNKKWDIPDDAFTYLSDLEIAEEYDAPPQTVRTIRRRRGLPRAEFMPPHAGTYKSMTRLVNFYEWHRANRDVRSFCVADWRESEGAPATSNLPATWKKRKWIRKNGQKRGAETRWAFTGQFWEDAERMEFGVEKR